MRKLLWTAFFSFCAMVCHAQGIAGKIKDKNNQPLEGATIHLLQLPDSIPVHITQSNSGGQYTIKQIAPGRYVLLTTMAGMEAGKAVFEIVNPGEKIILPDIILQPTLGNLKTVEVNAVTNALELKAGKLILNVDKSITAAGNSAFELLQKTPGVSVDADDNLLLKGNANINVTIDGRTSYLSPQQLTQLLKSMPAENLSRIEVIAVPSSAYDAAGNAGIINIVTKKMNRHGYALNIMAGAGAGRYCQTSEEIVGNIRTKQFNLFGSYNYSYNHTIMHRTSYRTIERDGKIINYDRISDDPAIASNHGYKLGIDFFVNKTNDIGFVYSGYSNHWQRDALGPTYLRDENGIADSFALNHNITVEPNKNNDKNINYRFKPDTLGTLISMDADYEAYHDNSDGHLGNGLYAINGSALAPYQDLAFDQPSKITIRSFKADATLPFANLKWMTGIKYSQVTSDNNFVYDSLVNGSYVYSTALSNHFIYEEKIFAAYVSFTKSLNKKMALDAGLRIEHTRSAGNSVTMKQLTARSYSNLFPYFSINKDLNNGNSLNFSFSRRINRPLYNNLNPFRYFFDKYSYTEGNPYLQPELSWKTSLAYTYRKKYITTIGYTRTLDAMLSFATQDSSTGVMRITTYNFDRRDLFDATFILPVKVTHFWNLQSTINLSYMHYVYQQNGISFQPYQFSADVVINNSWLLPGNNSAEITARYISPSLSGIYRLKYYVNIDAGWKKSFFKNKLDVKVSVSDILKSNHFWGYSVYTATNVRYNHTYDSRRIKVNFIWHFGGKLSAGREHKLEEQDRL